MVATNNWRFHVKHIIFVYWIAFQNPHSFAKTSRSIICETFICWDFIGFLWFHFDQMTILGLCDRFKKKSYLNRARIHYMDFVIDTAVFLSSLAVGQFTV